jgi:hypothetical protein
MTDSEQILAVFMASQHAFYGFGCDPNAYLAEGLSAIKNLYKFHPVAWSSREVCG